MFGTGIELHYPGEEETTFQTCAGSICSVLVTLLTLVFGVNSLLILFNYAGTSFTSANLEDHFDSSNIFTEAEGFQIAVALHYDFDG